MKRKASLEIGISDKLRVNMSYTCSYVTCFALSVWHTAWAVAGNSQTTAVFEAKFGWTTDDTIMYNTIISSGGIFGLVIGSFLGGSLLKLGRRKAFLIGQAFALLGAAICMAGTVPYLSIGRLFVGVAGGISSVTYSKFIMENMPEKLADKFSLCLNVSICIGLIPCFLMGELLPDPSDYQGNKDDELWRVIFAFPALIAVIVSVLVLLVFKHEPISYCIMNDLEEEG